MCRKVCVRERATKIVGGASGITFVMMSWAKEVLRYVKGTTGFGLVYGGKDRATWLLLLVPACQAREFPAQQLWRWPP
jgi:hypothetical protein